MKPKVLILDNFDHKLNFKERVITKQLRGVATIPFLLAGENLNELVDLVVNEFKPNVVLLPRQLLSRPEYPIEALLQVHITFAKELRKANFQGEIVITTDLFGDVVKDLDKANELDPSMRLILSGSDDEEMVATLKQFSIISEFLETNAREELMEKRKNRDDNEVFSGFE